MTNEKEQESNRRRFVIYFNEHSNEVSILDTEEDNASLFSWGCDSFQEAKFLQLECEQVADRLNYLNEAL